MVRLNLSTACRRGGSATEWPNDHSCTAVLLEHIDILPNAASSEPGVYIHTSCVVTETRIGTWSPSIHSLPNKAYNSSTADTPLSDYQPGLHLFMCPLQVIGEKRSVASFKFLHPWGHRRISEQSALPLADFWVVCQLVIIGDNNKLYRMPHHWLLT